MRLDSFYFFFLWLSSGRTKHFVRLAVGIRFNSGKIENCYISSLTAIRFAPDKSDRVVDSEREFNKVVRANIFSVSPPKLRPTF